jgi:hypothetical protein
MTLRRSGFTQAILLGSKPTRYREVVLTSLPSKFLFGNALMEQYEAGLHKKLLARLTLTLARSSERDPTWPAVAGDTVKPPKELRVSLIISTTPQVL